LNTDRPNGPTPPLRILIDGEAARDAQGTGLSTYARTLAKGLRTLGNEVFSLSGAPSSQNDPLVDAVSLGDQQPELRGARQKAQTLRRMAGGLTTAVAHARRVERNAVRPADGVSTPGPTYLSPDLFARAHYRHMLLRQFTEVRTPDRVDVLHLTSPLPLRMRGVRTVTTFHDLIPIRLPYTTPDNKAEFIARARTCARQSDLIIAVSEASKRDLVELLDVDPAIVAVTGQPVDLEPVDDAARAAAPARLAKYDLAPDGYALFVSAIEPKKNLRRLIEAFLEIDTDTPLVVVGRRAWMWDQAIGDIDTVFGPRGRARLRFLGYAGRQDLQALYAGARAFLFPSLYEGFGLPPLEAMAAGVPTLVSNVASLPEVCGEAAVYVDPLDRDDIRKGVERLLTDAGLRQRLKVAGPMQAATFSFDAYVAKLAAAYARLALS
jgi:glycosyltransferase involved in cell wall biosynthesis